MADLQAGRESPESLLVRMAGPRLRALGFDIPLGGGLEASYRLYSLLVQQGGGAHSRYNALVGRIVSFARAAEHATARR